MGRKKLQPGEKPVAEQVRYFAAMGWTTTSIAKKVRCSKGYVNQVRNPTEWIPTNQSLAPNFWDQMRAADAVYKKEAK